MGFLRRHPTATAAVLILVLLAVGTALIFAQGSFADDVSCEYQVLEIENQTFSSISEFEQDVKANGGQPSEFKERLDFRVRNGLVEYRADQEYCQKLREGGYNE